MNRLKSYLKIPVCKKINLTSIKSGLTYLSSKKYSTENHLSYSSGKSDYIKNMLGQTIPASLNKLAIERPNDTCYKFCLSQTTFTFKEVKQRVDEFSQSLINLGFKKGDRLGICF